ncbi:MAG: phosphatidylserine decarboxylase, partial [Planctomycetes bacterium]|nr:phosphatidylserine decarboxylase [Planctomycetota bacterium]
VAMTLADVAGGTRILVRQVAGALARRIVCAAAVGDRLERGGRYGMIKFGSRAEVYVPVESGFEVTVEPGQVVLGGQTVLGRFP